MNIKKTHIILFLLLSVIGFSQANISEGMFVDTDGIIQMHEDAQLGIHTHLENNGTFNENLGFTGFYHDTDILTVFGTQRPIFNNVDVAVVNNLELYNSVGVTGDFRFLEGKVITPRDQIDISLDYINYGGHLGEDNPTHVDGYTSVIWQNEFIFPIGDEDKFRPMILPNQSSTAFFEGAYFRDDPEAIITENSLIGNSFERTEKIYFVENISEWEFWDLNGSLSTQVTLTWDNDSNINQITQDLDRLIVVGWSFENERWESLGNAYYEGNFNSGKITSVNFTPNNYEIITFGAVRNQSNNFYISPNNDEYNQTVVFDELEEYEQGSLKVFNRWGNIVFESADYQNDFDGTSNGRATILKDRKLPDGTYFYEFEFGNETFENLMQGWIYISR